MDRTVYSFVTNMNRNAGGRFPLPLPPRSQDEGCPQTAPPIRDQAPNPDLQGEIEKFILLQRDLNVFSRQTSSGGSAWFQEAQLSPPS